MFGVKPDTDAIVTAAYLNISKSLRIWQKSIAPDLLIQFEAGGEIIACRLHDGHVLVVMVNK